MSGLHPWAILVQLVNNDPPILTPDEAKGVVLAHESANRRALQEIHALLPELMARGLLEPEGHKKLVEVVTRAFRNEMSDVG